MSSSYNQFLENEILRASVFVDGTRVGCVQSVAFSTDIETVEQTCHETGVTIVKNTGESLTGTLTLMGVSQAAQSLLDPYYKQVDKQMWVRTAVEPISTEESKHIVILKLIKNGSTPSENPKDWLILPDVSFQNYAAINVNVSAELNDITIDMTLNPAYVDLKGALIEEDKRNVSMIFQPTKEVVNGYANKFRTPIASYFNEDSLFFEFADDITIATLSDQFQEATALIYDRNSTNYYNVDLSVDTENAKMLVVKIKDLEDESNFLELNKNMKIRFLMVKGILMMDGAVNAAYITREDMSYKGLDEARMLVQKIKTVKVKEYVKEHKENKE